MPPIPHKIHMHKSFATYQSMIEREKDIAGMSMGVWRGTPLDWPGWKHTYISVKVD
jgi:hypothetical protein